MHAIGHKRHNVLPQTCVSIQSPQDVQSVDLYVHKNKDTLNMPDFTNIFLLEKKCVCVSTCGTELLSVSASLEGIANAVRDLMVIFRSPQLDDLGSEDSRAYKKINRQVITHLTWFGMT